jgi:tetratricopeptide (TPR) repeat protein
MRHFLFPAVETPPRSAGIKLADFITDFNMMKAALPLNITPKRLFRSRFNGACRPIVLTALMLLTPWPHAFGDAAGSNARATQNSAAVSDSRPETFGKNQVNARKIMEKHEAMEGRPINEKPPDPCEALIAKAHRYHREKRYPQAIRFYEDALKIQPGSTEVRFNLASALIAAEQYSRANSLLEELKRLQPDHSGVLLNLAIVGIYLGRPAGSLSLLEDVEKLKPEARFEVCLHRGVAYRMIEDWDQALYWYQQAYSINPAHHSLLFNMALVYDRLQLFSEAVHFYGFYLKHAGDFDPAEKRQIQSRMLYLESFMNTTSSGRSESLRRDDS